MKNWKSILLLVLVFFAGIAVGVVGTRVVVRRVIQQAIAHPERVQTWMEHRLTHRLQLDGDQQSKLHAILSDSHAQLTELRTKYRPEMIFVVSNANNQITAMLTPEQKKRFEELKKKDRGLLFRFPLWQTLTQNQNP